LWQNFTLKGPHLRFAATLAAALILLPHPARAECLGQGCYDLVFAFLAAIIGYVLLAIVLLVMLLRARWRKAGQRLLVVVLVVAVALPLAMQGWQSWKMSAMERREVQGTPPRLDSRMPLLLVDRTDCMDTACAAILAARGQNGLYVLPLEALVGHDLTQPLALADLPLQHWRSSGLHSEEIAMRVLPPPTRKDVAGKIDYVILSRWLLYQSTSGVAEAALRANPALAAMRQGELLHLAMAPVPSGAGQLSFADLRYDVLDLWLVDAAPGVPLLPGFDGMGNNINNAAEAAAQAICPLFDGAPDWPCVEGFR
jgi:hypothetical protein